MDEHSYTKNKISNAEVENASTNFCQKNAEPPPQKTHPLNIIEVFSVFN